MILPAIITADRSYRELLIPAADLPIFLAQIHASRAVGSLTVHFGTGGTPYGQMVWRERIIDESPVDDDVDSTTENNVDNVLQPR